MLVQSFGGMLSIDLCDCVNGGTDIVLQTLLHILHRAHCAMALATQRLQRRSHLHLPRVLRPRLRAMGFRHRGHRPGFSCLSCSTTLSPTPRTCRRLSSSASSTASVLAPFPSPEAARLWWLLFLAPLETIVPVWLRVDVAGTLLWDPVDCAHDFLRHDGHC